MKAFTIILIACLPFIAIGETTAQSYELYSFKLKRNANLVLQNKGGTVVVTTEPKTNPGNSISKYFIIRRLENGNSVVGSASDNSLFLKRSGSKIELMPIGNNTSDFEWKIDYSGKSCIIANPGNSRQAIRVNSSNQLSLAEVQIFSANNQGVNDDFMFLISTVTNTF